MFGLTVFCLVGWSAGFADTLVLIDSSRAGPHIHMALVNQQHWVRWPRSSRPDGGNRILSLVTGQDWEGDINDLVVRRSRDGQWYLPNARLIKDRGHLTLRARFLDGRPVAVQETPDGTVSSEALLLGLADAEGTVPTVSWSTTLPPGSLLVYPARNWDDARLLERRLVGRMLILEYPPLQEFRLGRYWLWGEGWPPGLPIGESGVIGMIEAREALAWLMEPQGRKWVPVDERIPGANRLLTWATEDGWVLAGVVGGLSMLTWVAALWWTGWERRKPFLDWALVAIVLAPGCFALADPFVPMIGLANREYLVIGLLGFACILAAVASPAKEGPMVLVSSWLLLAGIVANPSWSSWSGGLHGNPHGITWPTAALVACGICLLLAKQNLVRGLMLFFAGVLALGMSRWDPSLAIGAALAGLCCVIGWPVAFRLAMATFVVSVITVAVQARGLWRIDALITDIEHIDRPMFGHYLYQVATPWVFVLFLAACLVAALQPTYLGHQLIKSFRATHEATSLAAAAALFLSIVPLFPHALQAASMCLAACFSITLLEAQRAL